MVRVLARTLFLICLTGLLSACGGGSGNTEESTLIGTPGSGTTVAAPGEEAEPTLQVALRLVRTGSAPTNTAVLAGSSDFVRAEAIVTTTDSTPVAQSGILVTYTNPEGIGVFSPSTGTAISGAGGIASIIVSTGSVQGAGTIVASVTVDGNVINSDPVTIDSDGQGSEAVATSNFSVSMTLSSPSVSRENEGTVTISVDDLTIADNTDTSTVDGTIAEIVIVNGTASPLLTTSTDTSDTNGFSQRVAGIITNGTFTAQVLPGTTQGTATLTGVVIVPGAELVPDDIPFVSAGDGAPSLVLSVEDETPGIPPSFFSPRAATTVLQPIADGRQVFAMAEVRNIRFAPVAGARVDFSLSGSGRLQTPSLLTTNGVARTQIFPGTLAGPGTLRASASFAGVEIENDPVDEVSFSSAGDEPFEGVGTSNLNIEIGINNDAFTTADDRIVSAPALSNLYARVTRANDSQPVENVIVQFSIEPNEVGILFPGNGRTLTDATGIANARLSAGTIAGAGTATARVVIDGQLFNSDSVTYTSRGNDVGTVIPSISLTFNGDDADNGQANVVTGSNAGTVGVRVVDEAGVLIRNTEILVNTDLGTVEVDGQPAASNLVIESSDGTTSFSLLAPASLSVRTGQLEVRVGTRTAFLPFEVGIDDLRIGLCTGGTAPTDCVTAMTSFSDTEGSQMFFDSDMSGGFVSDTDLQALSTAMVTAVIVQETDPMTPTENPTMSFVPAPFVTVNLSSACGGLDPELAEFPDTVISDANGVIEFAYTDLGCSDDDTVRITEESTGAEARGTLTVRKIATGSIRFISAVPPEIQIKGSGTSTSNVTFQVLDIAGQPVEDADVTFGLTSEVGGLSLVGETPADPSCVVMMPGDCMTIPATRATNAEGLVTATVNAGTIPTTVRVRASVEVDSNGNGLFDDNETRATISDGLSVITGIPDQNSFSMASEDLNIEGEDFVAEQTRITVQLGDAFGNPVPDGTTVVFTTEYGVIEGNCETSGIGTCGVTLSSGLPRDPNDPATPGNRLPSSSCPNPLILDEPDAVAFKVGEARYTNFVAAEIHRVENAVNSQGLAETEYSVNSDGSGITCNTLDIPTICENNDLRISYTRAYLDEVGALADSITPPVPVTTADIPFPGKATAPFVQRTVNENGFAVPCRGDLSGVQGRFGIRAKSDVVGGYPGGLGQVSAGRSTILAYAQGEESFNDANSNGLYDLDETFIDLTEAVFDINEDGVLSTGTPGPNDASRDVDNPKCFGPMSPVTDPSTPTDSCFQFGGAEERFIDFGDQDTNNVSKDLNNTFDAGNSIYNGTLCPEEVHLRRDPSIVDETMDPLYCDNGKTVACTDTLRYCTRDLVNIRRELVVLHSGSLDPAAALRDRVNGEFVSKVDIAFLPTGNYYSVDQTVTQNDGNTIVSCTDDPDRLPTVDPYPFPDGAICSSFTIGWDDSDVPPSTGDTIDLVYSGRVVIDYSDELNGFPAGGSALAVAAGAGACAITNDPGLFIPDTNARGFAQTEIQFGPTLVAGFGSVSILLSTPKTSQSPTAFLFDCAQDPNAP